MKQTSSTKSEREQAIRARLIRLLQRAYSGELGAAIAYRGHAASISDPGQRERITRIRFEELDHRERVGHLLGPLGGAPDAGLEWRNRAIGTSISAFCRVGGWFLPMYGAGWIERRNIVEYEHAARLSALAGELDLADDLLDMAEVEWEHERYFRLHAASHWLAHLLPVWRAPGPREAIRGHFTWFLEEHALPTPLPVLLPLAESVPVAR
jgi:rubrerythrin